MSTGSDTAPGALVWTPAGSRLTLDLRGHVLTVEQQDDASWRSTYAKAGAPPGHILGFTTCHTRREAMSWAVTRIVPDVDPQHLLHLVGEARP